MSSLINPLDPIPLNILVAFPYFYKEYEDVFKSVDRKDFRLIVDSGAFSVWNSGLTIEMDEYCSFLDRISYLQPFNAVQLDVYGDAQKSYDNFLLMKQRNYDVMPVFTRGESEQRLDEFYKYTDYIMFGGIAVGGKNKNYVKWFMNRNKGRKVHWLGFTGIDFIKYFRPTSVDSSSWATSKRYGHLSVYDPESMMIRHMGRKDFINRPPKDVIEKLLGVGGTYKMIQDLGKQEAWLSTSKNDPLSLKNTVVTLSTLAHIKRSMDVERHFGTRMFLAVAVDKSSMQHIFDCFYHGRNLKLW